MMTPTGNGGVRNNVYGAEEFVVDDRSNSFSMSDAPPWNIQSRF